MKEVNRYRQTVIDVALSQLHETEPAEYWLDAFGALPPDYHKLAWCGVFALWCLRQANLTKRVWIRGKGFIWVDDNGKSSRVPYLPIIHSSRIGVGDVAYFDKPFQHYGIVEELGEDDPDHGEAFVKIIAGNTPDVDQSWVKRSKAQFYGINRLVEVASQLELPAGTAVLR